MTPRPRVGWAAVALAFACALLAPSTASAHDVRPGAVALREVAPDRFAVRLTPADDGGAAPVRPTPRWPPGCAVDADHLQCADGLTGTVRFPQLVDRRVTVGVFVCWLDGARVSRVLRPGQASVRIARPGDGAVLRESAETLSAWVVIGSEHVLFGLDHLLFVWALCLVVGLRRALFGALLGFTAGHSVTLLAVSLGWLAPPPLVTETVIALSVLLLAVEAADPRPSWTRDRPWLVATSFGLVHGMGFAGALSGLGLPSDGLVPSLLAFNLGVEVGQLLVLLPALALAWWARDRPSPRTRLALVYLVGIPAGLWSVERSIALVHSWVG